MSMFVPQTLTATHVPLFTVKAKWQKAGPLHAKNISQMSARNKRSDQCQTQQKLLQS